MELWSVADESELHGCPVVICVSPVQFWTLFEALIGGQGSENSNSERSGLSDPRSECVAFPRPEGDDRAFKAFLPLVLSPLGFE